MMQCVYYPLILIKYYSTSTSREVSVTPCMIYSDADTCKTVILTDNIGKAGIYR